ncbi:MAG: HAD-IIB family hydrolase [Clostridia bacterium]
MILFFDVDGTIYDHSMGVSPSFKKAFPILKEQGHTVCLNTGRTKMIIPDSVLALDFDGIVAGSGSYIEYKNQVLFEKYIPQSVIEKALRAFENIAICVETYDFVYMNEKMARIRLSTPESKLDSHSQINHVEPSKFQFRNSLPEYNISKPVNKISYLADDGERDIIHSILGGCCNILEENNPIFSMHYGEAVAKGCSKAEGGELLRTALGGGKAVAFGDGMNDVDMFRWADISVAMGNALPKIKAMADYVCGDFMGNGILDILGELGIRS